MIYIRKENIRKEGIEIRNEEYNKIRECQEKEKLKRMEES